MSKDPKSLDNAIAVMKKAGWRITEQRKSIYQILSEKSEPISPKDILSVHKKMHPEKSMDLVTIYRIMDKFQEIGLIHKIGQGGQYVVCEHLGCQSSFHIVEFCKICKKAVEKHVPLELVSKIFEFVKDKHGFISSEHSFCLEGYCDKCQ